MAGSIAHKEADALRAALKGELHTSDGGLIEVPAATRDALMKVVDVLESSPGAVVLPADSLLTTGQAAEVLGVSRMTVVRLVDKGELRSSGAGSHRRIAATELVRYREDRRRSRHEAVHGLAQDVADDTPPDRVIPTR